MQDELTAEQQRSYDNGIRIFARWIARAYLKDMTDRNSAVNESRTNPAEEKEDNGNQRRIRGKRGDQSGQNQVGYQEENPDRVPCPSPTELHCRRRQHRTPVD